MNGRGIPSDVRERSRSARERSTNLRVVSQHLRQSLETLRASAAEAGTGLAPDQSSPSRDDGHLAPLPLMTPMDFAARMRQRVYKARMEAQELRRRAAALKHQAVEFRARSKDLLSGTAPL